MSNAPASTTAADYGLDAPTVVRNLLLAATTGFLLWGSGALRLWSGWLVLGPLAGVTLRFPLTSMGLWSGLGCGAMALWMIWSSKVGKLKGRERLLDRITWTGGERVLDVGCGRGLMLIGAAKRLTSGRATGIDIWQARDLSGNRPGATLDNARREQVVDRVAVYTADMRRMPFPDGTFDVVLSSAAVHNLYSASDRAQAIGEIARVLKPGGQALIDDIRHHGEYAATFVQHGCSDVRRFGSVVVAGLLAVITFGALRPATLLVRKS